MTDLIPGRTSEIYAQIRPVTGILLRGSVISIDPSIGSTSSQPAFAYFRAGELIETGKADIDPSLEIYQRLQLVAQWVRRIYKSYQPDVVVCEEIPDQRYMPLIGGKPMATGNNVKAHASLLKAVGAILSVSGPDYIIGMRPQVWQARAPAEYQAKIKAKRKTDIEDAIYIGTCAIEIAQAMEAEDGTTPGGRKRGSRSRSRVPD